MAVGEAPHSNMALERLAVMLGLIQTQKYCKSLILLGNFDSRADRQASFFLSVGKRRTIPRRKKRHILSFDIKCGNKHNTSQTILKLHRRLADEIQRPENTWRKDKSRNQREADITTMRETVVEKRGPSALFSFLQVDLPLQIFSSMSPY